MSLNNVSEKCAVCQAYLFEEDDVVYCPQCGAPHHRECYNAIGHCGLEQYHGTENQYKKMEPKPKEEPNQTTDNSHGQIVCAMCGNVYDKEASACPNCGAPDISKMGGKFINFDFLGGIPADMDIGDGVTANEAKMFVGANTQRYIPKFASFKIGKKLSWNWAAFLFPCAWFASRKMYAKGIIMGTLQIAFTMLLLPFNKAISYLDFSEMSNYLEISKIISENFDSIGKVAIIAAVVGITLEFLLRLLSGLIADYFYKNRVINGVKEIKDGIDDPSVAYHRRGGVSLTAALLGIMAVQYLPSIFASITGIL